MTARGPVVPSGPVRPLQGQVAVVTGSASGIGRAIAFRLAEAGADVVIHARSNRVGAEETAEGVRTRGGQTLVINVDLAEQASHELLVEEAWNWHNGVQIWVNNAGVDVLTGAHRDAPFEDKLEWLWRVDVVASIRLSRLVGAKMLQAARRGSPPDNRVILLMGWDQAGQGMAGDSGEMFATIKGAVMSFSRSLARSLAPHVRVNCLAPGWIRTRWGEEASPYWQARAVNESLLQRWGTPADVAAVAEFLATPAAAFITGETIAINGGFRTGAVNPERNEPTAES